MRLCSDTQQELLDTIAAKRAARDAILQQPEATRDFARELEIGREIRELTAAFNAETVRAATEQLARLRARPAAQRRPKREQALEEILRVRGVDPDAAPDEQTGGAK